MTLGTLLAFLVLVFAILFIVLGRLDLIAGGLIAVLALAALLGTVRLGPVQV